MSPAIQPRAMWAFVPNLELAATMDATWMLFMRALAAALSANEDLSMSRKCVLPYLSSGVLRCHFSYVR